MQISRSVKRAGAALAATAALVMVNPSTASANWSSYINSWTDGEKSRTWEDQGTYSQIQFTDCFAQYGTTKSVVVKLWHYYSVLPNESLGTKTFTACFDGSTSNGQWTNVPSGTNTLQFEADKVAQGGSCCLLNVGTVYVDTSKSD
ncbi:hypothetical protein [Streptomyces sp. JH34]|uniref:hypothetical protein n=1 Tax=Streptomyces sp. JH34 TaxID=2793633 RepID=UPI0023F6F010|nr:hypothetical protein [Streptomyces sp. JH34]MDF6019187.1 hypothetical protein [Streptomyces sp. JH34]